MQEAQVLKDWYLENQRPLPWRMNRDPYRIWISEMMLQQTTVAAVMPFYERFMKKFPTVQILQKAPLAHVLEMWAGLGYYSRARNIHKSAQVLGLQGFPKNHKELIELPGFGPYTARAVSSLAFGEKVGVVDGNVIRVLSRYYGLAGPWWTTAERNIYQTKIDAWVEKEDPSLINQAVMDLGATICTPQSPACLLCPLSKKCVARLTQKISELPVKKPKKDSEVWMWDVDLHLRGSKIGLVKNDYLPFLKGQMIFPGTALKMKKKPKIYDIKHGITHHDIFVRVKKAGSGTGHKVKWINTNELQQINPSSLLQKIIDFQNSSLS